MNSIGKTNENQEPKPTNYLAKAAIIVLVAAPFLAYALLSPSGASSMKQMG